MQNDKFLNKDKTQAILDTRPAGVPINEALNALAKQGYTIEGFNDVSLAEKAGNVIGGVAKTVASDLLVRPVSRTTEAVTRTLFPDSVEAKGYEAYADENKPVQSGVFGIEVPQPGTGTQAVKNIVGETAQTASYLIPYGKVASGVAGATGSKLLGQLTAGTAGGYTADVGMGLQDENQTVGEALTPGVGTAIGVGLPLGFAGAQVAGRTLQKTGQGMAGSVLPIGEQEAGIIQSYIAKKPFLERVTSILSGTDNALVTSGSTAVGQSLFGTKKMIGVQAKRAQDNLWNKVIKPQLEGAKVQIDLPEYFKTVEKKIIEDTPELTRQKALLEALNSFKDDYSGVNTISLDRLQKLKEGWAEFVPEKFYKGQNIAGNARQVSALLADEARQTIYNTLGNDVKQAYFDYGNLMGLAKMGQTAMTGQKLKGGTGGFISELASRAVTPVGTVGGNVIYRLGQGLEFIGKAGAKTLDEVLGLNKNQVLNQPTNTQTNQIATNKVKNVNMSGTIPQATKKANGKTIPKELQPLAEEAKKYKSADAFIKAQGKPIYHGSTKADVINKEGFKLMPAKDRNMASAFGDGIYFADKKSGAYSTKPENLIQAYIPKDLKLKKVSDSDAYKIDTQKLIKEGYGGVELFTGNGKNITIFDPSNIKTKRQLIDLYNQVNGKK